MLLAAGEQRWQRLALAPAFTILITTVTAVVSYRWQMPYSILPVVLTTAILVVIFMPLRLIRYGGKLRLGTSSTQEDQPRSLSSRADGEEAGGVVSWAGDLIGSSLSKTNDGFTSLMIFLAGIGAAIVTIFRIALEIIHPWAPSQTYDAVYHLNVLAAMRAEKIASPWQMNIDTYPDMAGFYPNGWHQVTSLLIPLGTDLATLANASALAIIVVIWPISLGTLLWVVTKNRALVFTAVLLSQSLPQFPQLFFSFGTLYPNLLGFAMLPGLLAMGIDVITNRGYKEAILGTIVSCAAVVGLAISHPASLIALALLAPAFIGARISTWWFEERRSSAQTGLKYSLPAFAVAAVVALVVLALSYFAFQYQPRLAAMQVHDSAGWLPSQPGLLRATFKAGTLANGVWFTWSFTLSWILGGLLLVGAWYGLKQPRMHGLIIAHGVASILYIVSDGDWNLQRRAFLTGMFYTDPMRLAALSAITALPLIAIGVFATAKIVVGRWKARAKDNAHSVHTRGRLVGTLVALALSFQLFPGHFALASQTQSAYLLPKTQGDGTGMLTSDEYKLMRRVAEHVPASDTVLGNPWTGTAYVWALADRQAVYPDMASTGGGIYGWRLAKAANQIMEHPTGCEAVEQRRAYWLLDFGHHYLWNGEDPSRRFEFFQGLEGLEEAGYAQVVDQEGEARLLRITHCQYREKEVQ
ncbi:MAG: hypothetical protein Q4P06_03850 [Actinomycetaceae bacterium]|nr:hypothetical protein [Actinomycetaceae bacterium]